MSGACLSSIRKSRPNVVRKTTVSMQRAFGGSVMKRDNIRNNIKDSMLIGDKRMKCWRRRWSAVDRQFSENGQVLFLNAVICE